MATAASSEPLPRARARVGKRRAREAGREPSPSDSFARRGCRGLNHPRAHARAWESARGRPTPGYPSPSNGIARRGLSAGGRC
jgi:hypothetical protein